MVKRHFVVAAAVAAALSAALLASCSQPGATSTPSASTPVTVRLLAHDSFVISDALIEQLRKEQGIDLQVITGGDAGTVVSGAVLTAGSPSADVLFGVDNITLARALDAGVFDPYRSPAADTLLPELERQADVVTPVDYGDVCINLDDTWFAERNLAPPSTLADLAAPQYRDLLVVEDPAASSPGLAFLLATIARYPDSWQDYWGSLRDNGVLVAGSWTDAYVGQFSGGGDGERPIVVSYATSPPAELVYASDPKPARPSTSVMTDGCFRQVEYAGVLAGTQQPEAARRVVDWLLSPQVQADVPLSMFVFPARQGIPLPQLFTDFAAQVPEPLTLPGAEVAANLDAWLADWDAVMGR